MPVPDRAHPQPMRETAMIPKIRGPAPMLILFTGLGALALAWGAFLLVDIAGFRGWSAALYEALYHRNPERSQVWVILFTEAGPVEMVQWLLLVLAAGLAFHVHGRLFAGSAPSRENLCARTFWLLMGIAFLLMLIEDAGNPRHWFRHFFWEFLGDREGKISELIFFAALGAVPLTALGVFGRPILRLPKTRGFLLGGFVFYAIAVGSSTTRYYWYEAAGHWLHVRVFGEALREVSLGSQGHGFWLMDYLVEESLELVGATLLAAAAAAFLREYKALFR